jgi:hypothetical protein
LRRTDHLAALAVRRLGLERHSKKALVQVQIQPVVVGPYRIAGVVGGIGFGYHSIDAAEPVNQIMIRTLAAHVIEKRFA